MFRMTSRATIAALVATFALTTSLAAQQTVLPLWPHGAPEPAQTTDPEKDVTKDSDAFINGHRTVRLTNVTNPTMTVYQPAADKNTRTAALVFPGGGYVRLAWTGEGVDTCDWLTSVGITCLLVKYRVPEQGHYPANFADLEDAQQAMRLARSHAGDWNIDPAHIGVVGFSAGANLAVLLSTHPDDHHVETTSAARDIPGIASQPSGGIKLTGTSDARPNFAIIVYPAYLIADDQPAIDPVYTPNQFTPPTFLIQAEDDKNYHRNAPIYFQALAEAKVPSELHMYSTGGHGFGIHPPKAPEEHWTRLADAWLRSINMLPPYTQQRAQQPNPHNLPSTPAGIPCTTPSPVAPSNQPTQPGRPNPTTPTAGPMDNPCFQQNPM